MSGRPRTGTVGRVRHLSRPGRLGAVMLGAVVVSFFALPLVAITARMPLGEVVDVLTSRVVLDALRVSVVTTLAAHAFVLTLGTPLAYLLARHTFPGRGLVVGVLELPIVLPPAVAGIGLLAAFGHAGVLGGRLAAAGISIPFTPVAVVIAVIFVSGPFYLRQAMAAFEAVDFDLIDTARTLGASPVRSFLRVALPLALPGLEAGSALALARGFGEFGATIMFAGNLQGVTQTLPLAVYTLLDVDFPAALAVSALLIMFGIVLLLSNRMIVEWSRSRLT